MTENYAQTDKEDAAENPTPPRQRTAWSQTPDVKPPDTKEKNIKNCTYDPNENLLVAQGDLVRVGTLLTTTTQSKYAGQIYKIEG